MSLVSRGSAVNQWVPIAGCQTSGGGGPTELIAPFSEPIPVLAGPPAPALANLSQAPDPASPISLVVNGRAFYASSASPAFTVSGTTIAWISTIYSVAPGDEVIAVYYAYLE